MYTYPVLREDLLCGVALGHIGREGMQEGLLE